MLTSVLDRKFSRNLTRAKFGAGGESGFARIVGKRGRRYDDICSFYLILISITSIDMEFDSLLFSEEDILPWSEPLFYDVVIDVPEAEESPDKKSQEIETNTNEKHTCPKCNKTFAFRSRLERHLTTHQVCLLFPTNYERSALMKKTQKDSKQD